VPTIRNRRERFPWFPTINSHVCLRDLDCLNFCPAGVFDWDRATGRPIVARPFDCIPGCRSCADRCKAKGISLPGRQEVLAALKRMRAVDALPSQPEERQRRGRAVPKGPNRNLAKGNKRKPRNPRNPRNHLVIMFPAGGNKSSE
jgi:NAD-dependent dihydropyrimidine dehydrogenase PreA subunit